MTPLPALRSRDSYRQAAAKLVAVVKLVAPEVHPLHVVPSHTLPAAWRCTHSVLGYTGRDLSARLAAIGDLNPWHGPDRPAIVIDLERLKGNAHRRAKRQPEAKDVLFSRSAAEVLLHELGHVLTWAADPSPPAPAREHTLPPARHFEKMFSARRDTAVELGLQLMHDDRFTRAALHVCHRARAANVHADPLLVVGELFRPFDDKQYKEALGDEPQRLEHLPIGEVLRTPAPRAFSERYRDDLLTWWHDHERAGLTVSRSSV